MWICSLDSTFASPRRCWPEAWLQKFYRKSAIGNVSDLLKNDLYEYYSDQSHFTKEFRKMTGYSPRKFSLKFQTNLDT